MRQVAQEVGVDEATLRRWVIADDVAPQYARAREQQADAHADHAIAVAQDAVEGRVDPAAARLLVDTLKWRAGKFHPRVFGDRQVQQHEGSVEVRIVEQDSDD